MSTFRRGRRQVEWGWIGDGVGGLWIAFTILSKTRLRRLHNNNTTSSLSQNFCGCFQEAQKGRNMAADPLVSIVVDLVLVLRIWFDIYRRDL